MGGVQKTKFNSSDFPDVYKSIAWGHGWNFRKMFLTPGSTNFIIPANVFLIRALVWGGGGSGRFGNYGKGGGGGGYTEHYWDCVPGTSLSIVVGAGGSAATAIGDGNTGGTSSLIDTVASVSLSATGGVGGTGIYTGNPGGEGLGGTINFNGGAGGASTNLTSGSASGGGAAGSVLGDGGNGGAVVTESTTYANGGGGAIGGHKGGNGGAINNYCGSGAGVHGPGGDGLSIASRNGGPGMFPGGQGAAFGTNFYKTAECGRGSLWWDAWDIDGSGGGSGYTTNIPAGAHGGPGAGGGAGYSYGGAGGILGGGGAGGLYGGNGGRAGGGGGCTSDASAVSSGAGGDGLVILYW